MSSNPNATQEIIIVKRSGEEEDHHHGGAWKIAFADFMTAMMALFLVLWLVNASSESTKQSVASYFNPVQLVDRHRSERGLYEPTGFTELQLGDQIGADGEDQAAGEAAKPEITQAEFFAEPDRVLDEIAASAAETPMAVQASDAGLPNQAADTADFIDPFQPLDWTQGSQAQTDAGADIVRLEQDAEPLADAGTDSAVDDGVTEASEQPDTPSEADAEASDASALEQRSQELEMTLREALIAEGLEPSRIEVVAEGGKVLVSIADDEAGGMFAIGSAVPLPQTVNAVATIGAILARSDVNVRIEGHTDARPFAGGGSDNWQLSADRAQAVLYMLLRGGLEELRVQSVAGSADRVLADPVDPFSARNRRVDILVELVEDVQ